MLPRLGRQQLGQDVPFQRLEGFAVAEEVRHADQHVLQQRWALPRIVADEVTVRLQGLQSVDLHAALDAAQHGGPLVAAEVVPGLCPQHQHDVPQGLFVHIVADLGGTLVQRVIRPDLQKG
jgi:hypothetical protein